MTDPFVHSSVVIFDESTFSLFTFTLVKLPVVIDALDIDALTHERLSKVKLLTFASTIQHDVKQHPKAYTLLG